MICGKSTTRPRPSITGRWGVDVRSTFTYKGDEDMHKDLRARSGQSVTVSYRIGVEGDKALYRCRFADGYCSDLYADELDPQPDPSSPAHGVLRPCAGA